MNVHLLAALFLIRRGLKDLALAEMRLALSCANRDNDTQAKALILGAMSWGRR